MPEPELTDARSLTPPPDSVYSGVSFGMWVFDQEDNWYLLVAEVWPAPSRWLPWPGRTSRWWFEVSAWDPQEESWWGLWPDSKHGAGGGFTFRQCYKRALAGLRHYEDKALFEEGRLL